MKSDGVSLEKLRSMETLSNPQAMGLVIRLSIPSILAELSSLLMSCIDAAMVGSLGADATASIGLVATSTWMCSGLCISLSYGFSVQIAQLIGARREEEARNVTRQALLTALIFGGVLLALGVSLSPALPGWLGGDAAIRPNATRYFFVYSCALPVSLFRVLTGSILQCSGDMRTPSLLNAAMCLMDVVFNFFLIFPSRQLSLFGLSIPVCGAGLGVTGAALGTALAELVAAVLMLWAMCVRSPKLRLAQGGSWRLEGACMRRMARVSLPIALERTVLRAAQITSTLIVAPLGVTAIAADSLAVTAEGLCYMPAYGIAAAATTLVGQSIGAQRRDLARRFARLSVVLGMLAMAVLGTLMYAFAPQLFRLMTPAVEVQQLSTHVLRIEAFAEPLFGASIIAAGALRGAGDTLVPSVMNLVTIWGLRITGALLLVPHLGLTGVWLSMCIELSIRGVLFLIRLLREKWLDRSLLDVVD